MPRRVNHAASRAASKGSPLATRGIRVGCPYVADSGGFDTSPAGSRHRGIRMVARCRQCCRIRVKDRTIGIAMSRESIFKGGWPRSCRRCGEGTAIPTPRLSDYLNHNCEHQRGSARRNGRRTPRSGRWFGRISMLLIPVMTRLERVHLSSPLVSESHIYPDVRALTVNRFTPSRRTQCPSGSAGCFYP